LHSRAFPTDRGVIRNKLLLLLLLLLLKTDEKML
jgi:hypothetical protein